MSQLLLNCEGSDGSTALIDSSLLGNTVTASGGAVLSTTSPLVGTSSAVFNGSTSRLTIPYNSAMEFGTNLWTIEFFYKTTHLAADAKMIMYKRGSSWIDGAWHIYLYNGVIGFDCHDVSFYNVGSTSTQHSDGNKHHYALVWNGTSFLMFSDGILENTVTWGGGGPDGINALAVDLLIGWGYDNSLAFPGTLDDIRIHIGDAIYTSNFTPPISPLTNYYPSSSASLGLSLIENLNITNIGLINELNVNLAVVQSIDEIKTLFEIALYNGLYFMRGWDPDNSRFCFWISANPLTKPPATTPVSTVANLQNLTLIHKISDIVI